MTIEYHEGRGWCTISCTHDPGKIIACFPTKAQAMAQHRAIESTKAKSAKKIEINLGEL